MFREMLKSKVHRATITDARLDYVGSLSLCPTLMKEADLLEYEKVLIANIDNGHRFETYIITGQPGEVCTNGAAAHLGKPGEKVIIMGYGLVDETDCAAHKPKIVVVGENNAIDQILG